MDISSIGQRIYQVRKRAGLTQKELGIKIGKTESSIQKYEKGSTEIPLSVLLHIADALDCELYEFLESEYFKHMDATDAALDKLTGALGYSISFENERIVKNGYAYHFSMEELLKLYDDIKLSAEDILNVALKNRRETRQRIDNESFTYSWLDNDRLEN